LGQNERNHKDFTNEWQFVDSIGYSNPRDFVLPGQSGYI
jgi:hypothetical protein